VVAQTALYNRGNMQIHEAGQLGFHTDFINDAEFENNMGLAGFYGRNLLNVSGAFIPSFFDIEIANDVGVTMETTINVKNVVNFIVRDFITPRNIPDVYVDFMPQAFYVGEADLSKVDGYSVVRGQQSFQFPIGDAAQFRPLTLNSDGVNDFARCAYFLEDPNSPSTFPPFRTDLKPRDIGEVSIVEFWRLEGSVPSTVRLTWTPRSNLAAIADDINQLTVMGWSKSGNRWISLGAEGIDGDLSNGFINSTTFVPNDYEILTFGSAAEATEILTLDNYFLSPNGDGVNDALVIPELELSPNNSLSIFDRNGLKVFQMTNYTNQFIGFANVDNFVIRKEAGLPEGIYFYVVTLDDLGTNYQGFLYLDR